MEHKVTQPVLSIKTNDLGDPISWFQLLCLVLLQGFGEMIVNAINAFASTLKGIGYFHWVEHVFPITSTK